MLPTPRRYGCSIALSSAFFLFFGALALVSRFRKSHEINALFKQGVGAEYQSWAEHFLSGFASPSLLFLFALMFGWMLSLFPNGQWNWKFVLRAKGWLKKQSPWALFDFLLVFCCETYSIVSFGWEFSQYLEHDIFQFGQLFCDVSGSIIWLLVVRQCTLIHQSQKFRDLSMDRSHQVDKRVGTCTLCDQENTSLKESHSIPKFVYQWIKDTSPTPYFRSSDNVNIRVQDGPK